MSNPGPFQRAQWVYQNEPCTRTWEEDLRLHFFHGFVFSTPDFFIMGRAVSSKANHTLILNPVHQFPREEHDCWHVYLFAGEMARAWSVLPYELPMFSLERRNELRFYRFADVARHTRLAHV